MKQKSTVGVERDSKLPRTVEPLEDDALVSRREFVARASELAVAMSVFSPGIDTFLRRSAPLHAGSAPADATSTSLAGVFPGLRWRMLGPFRGGRTAAASGVPGRPNEFYFGSVNGGVWKSIDAGRVWSPVFDSQPVASIGAIAIAPSAPDTVYVGSGESTLRDSTGFGNGVYKSIDAGKTWAHLGLDETHHIGKIAIDPHNPDVVLVAAIGKLYAANPERGVFRTTDGGRTWKKVLGTNDVGAVDVVIDPSDSRIVFAGLWNTRRPPWFTYAPTNGPGGGIFKSTDGGITWRQITTGLPQSGIGRTGIAIASSNPRRVYAIVDCLLPEAPPTVEPPLGTPPPVPSPQPGAPAATGRPAPPPPGQGGLFRSDDAGETWTKMSGDMALWGRGWYFEKIAIDPKDADTIYVPNVAVNRSRDGGKSWVVLRGSPGGDDYHQAWISPSDSNTMIVASDQGAIITNNATDDPRTVTWSSWLNQPTAQLYHLSVDYRLPYWVTAAQQDSGAIAVRSRGKFAEISMHDWEPIAPGGESGYTAGDPLNPGIVYGGSGTRYNLDSNTPIEGTTSPKSPEKARADWTQPLVFSKANPRALYYANQFLFKTIDGARTWTQISPDLTRPDPGVPTTLDATAAAATDRNGKRGVIYTIAPSPLNATLIWIGTDDGNIQLTSDDGVSWSNVTPAAISAWSRVTMIEASHFDPRSAYASVDRHQLQDFDPYIYRTRDMGKSWTRITQGLPSGVYVHSVKEDPARRGLLFAATERGMFASLDDGETWQSLQLNVPVTSMRDIEIYGKDLIIATHGRGLWVIDDITPLRQINDGVLKAEAWLFKPADAIDVFPTDDNGTPLQRDEPQTPNPTNGASIDFYLSRTANGPVTLEILDSRGKLLHTFSSVAQPAPPTTRGRRSGGLPSVSPLWQSTPDHLSGAAGLHRVMWEPVSPPGPESDVGAGGGGQAEPPQRLAGTFTARLTVNGKTLTQTFTIKPDPRLASVH